MSKARISSGATPPAPARAAAPDQTPLSYPPRCPSHRSWFAPPRLPESRLASPPPDIPASRAKLAAAPSHCRPLSPDLPAEFSELLGLPRCPKRFQIACRCSLNLRRARRPGMAPAPPDLRRLSAALPDDLPLRSSPCPA